MNATGSTFTLTATGLSKRFQREWIFRNFNYTFNSGNTYAVLGPNGSGKSTLLQVLWGQLIPTAGEIQAEDSSGKIAPDQLYRHLAIAAPYLQLVEEFTVEEHIRFHFRMKQTEYTTEELVVRMGFESARHRQVSRLSSGMKQRLKLGLALNSKVNLFFLDEPFTNLDAINREWYLQQLEALNREAIVIIAANHTEEYPESSFKINIGELK